MADQTLYLDEAAGNQPRSPWVRMLHTADQLDGQAFATGNGGRETNLIVRWNSRHQNPATCRGDFDGGFQRLPVAGRLEDYVYPGAALPQDAFDFLSFGGR